MVPLIKFVKELQYLTPWRRYFFHRYEYFFTPRDLWFLCEQMEAAVSIPGAIIEIGCAHGATATYLNVHLDYLQNRNILREEKKYFCLDTFSGFVAEDIAFEVNTRGKDAAPYSRYQVNNERWVNKVFASHGFKRASAIKGDANSFAFERLGPFCFALLDVDLYQPTIRALKMIYQNLTPGGIIVVDDCKLGNVWDGAHQAYSEFVEANGLPADFHLGKFGLIRKPTK